MNRNRILADPKKIIKHEQKKMMHKAHRKHFRKMNSIGG